MVVALALAGCGGEGDDGGGNASEATTTTEPAPDTFRTVAMVTQADDEATELCLQIDEHGPPDCSWPLDVELRDWSWDAVEHEVTVAQVASPDRASETTWGIYELEGTWEGGAFAVSKFTTSYASPQHSSNLWPDYGTECPEPADGWFADVDLDRLGNQADEALDAYISAQ